MAKRKVTCTVIVYRNGKPQNVFPGDDAFDFTADEIKEIELAQPGAFAPANADIPVDATSSMANAAGAGEGTDTGTTAKGDGTSGGSGSAAKATSTTNKTNKPKGDDVSDL
jgi:hypothetical protein